MFPITTVSPARLAVGIGCGGALGAAARWALAVPWHGGESAWPWPTLIVNVVGCLAIGLVAQRVSPGTIAWGFLVTGVLGGFTTFSAFAVQLNDMVDADRSTAAIAYGVVTLVGGVGATMVARLPRRTP